MARRTGLPKIQAIALSLCRAITLFTPIIRKLYGDNVALMTALEATHVACSALEEQLSLVIEQGD